jgi:hypothetical protein
MYMLETAEALAALLTRKSALSIATEAIWPPSASFTTSARNNRK